MMTTRRCQRRTRRTANFSLECLDDRVVPSTIGARLHVAPLVAAEQVRPEPEAILAHGRAEARPAASNPAAEAPLYAVPLEHGQRVGTHHHKAHLPAKVSARLQRLYAQYRAFLSAGASGTFVATRVGGAVINGTSVGIKVRTAGPANFKSTLAQLQGAGLQVTQVSGTKGTIVGMLPIGQLPAVAKLPSAVSVALPSNVGAQLQTLYAQYQAYVNAGGKGDFSPTGVDLLVLNGTNVGISVHTTDIAHFQTILAKLRKAGLNVIDQSTAYGLINGMLPIGQLPALAGISSTLSITPMIKPRLS